MRLPFPDLVWHLSLLLLVGLSACGPAPSDQAPILEPRARLGGPSEPPPVSQNSPSIHHAPVTPAPLPEHLVLPQWIAQALYWSASTFAGNPTLAWDVVFGQQR